MFEHQDEREIYPAAKKGGLAIWFQCPHCSYIDSVAVEDLKKRINERRRLIPVKWSCHNLDCLETFDISNLVLETAKSTGI